MRRSAGMQVSTNGLSKLRGFEGLRLKAYKDSGGILTIGYGHTGTDVYEGQLITEAQAEFLLRSDAIRAETTIHTLVKVPLNQNQMDALVCLVFNIGIGAFRNSTLLKKLNSNDYQGAADEFPKWNNVNHKPDPGLTRRRESERALFLEPIKEPVV